MYVCMGEESIMVKPVKKESLYQCANCGYVNLLYVEKYCPQCHSVLDWHLEHTSVSGDETREPIKQVVGVLGAVIMLLGMFANAKQYLYHSESLVEIGNGSWTVALFAVIALFLAATKLHKWQWIPCVLAVANLGFLLHRLQVEFLEMKVRMEEEAGNNYFVGLARSVNQMYADTYTIVPDAWLIISAGILMIIASMLIKSKE